MAEPVPLTIRRDWPRPDAKTLAAFKDAPTGFVFVKTSEGWRFITPQD